MTSNATTATDIMLTSSLPASDLLTTRECETLPASDLVAETESESPARIIGIIPPEENGSRTNNAKPCYCQNGTKCTALNRAIIDKHLLGKNVDCSSEYCPNSFTLHCQKQFEATHKKAVSSDKCRDCAAKSTAEKRAFKKSKLIFCYLIVSSIDSYIL